MNEATEAYTVELGQYRQCYYSCRGSLADTLDMVTKGPQVLQRFKVIDEIHAQIIVCSSEIGYAQLP